jgi:hypothetical protein
MQDQMIIWDSEDLLLVLLKWSVGLSCCSGELLVGSGWWRWLVGGCLPVCKQLLSEMLEKAVYGSNQRTHASGRLKEREGEGWGQRCGAWSKYEAAKHVHNGVAKGTKLRCSESPRVPKHRFEIKGFWTTSNNCQIHPTIPHRIKERSPAKWLLFELNVTIIWIFRKLTFEYSEHRGIALFAPNRPQRAPRKLLSLTICTQSEDILFPTKKT